MTESPKVEQVDREAAFNLFQAVNGGNNPLLRNNYLSGFFDNTNEVIAFARHRELATLTEPERTAKTVAEAVAAERERCARIASLFIINRNSIHPDIEAEDMSAQAKMIAHTTCQYVADAIRDEGAGG